MEQNLQERGHQIQNMNFFFKRGGKHARPREGQRLRPTAERKKKRGAERSNQIAQEADAALLTAAFLQCEHKEEADAICTLRTPPLQSRTSFSFFLFF